MAILLSFNIIGDDGVKKGLAAIQGAIADLRPFWREEFAPKYFGMVQDLFSTSGRSRGAGGRFSGGAWAWNTPAYRAWKAKNYPGLPILTRTGKLRNSLRWNGQSLGEGGVFDPQPNFMIAGTSIPYGRFHQNGTGKMVSRPFLPPPDPEFWAPVLFQWILKTKAKAQAG